MNKAVMIAIVPFFLIISGCTSGMTVSYTDPADHSYELIIDAEVSNKEAVKEAAALIENNLRFAEKEDIEGYLSTIKSSAHINTRSELEAFFDTYDLEHTILEMTLLDQEADIMLIEVRQQSVVRGSSEAADEYKDHLAIANYTFEKENNEWKIADTTMTETLFIE